MVPRTVMRRVEDSSGLFYPIVLFDCFGTAVSEHCSQGDRLWREGCREDTRHKILSLPHR